MSKKQMRKSEIKDLIAKVSCFFDGETPFSKKDMVELVDEQVIAVKGIPMFFLSPEPLPLLKAVLGGFGIVMKQVTVDMGAVKFVTSGADVMRPGIVNVGGGIDKGDPVLIVDEVHGKPLAIGQALFSGAEMAILEKGKVISVLHHVGDAMWQGA